MPHFFHLLLFVSYHGISCSYAPYTFFPTCVPFRILSPFNVFSYYICFFLFISLHLIASLPCNLPPPICCLHSFSFSLVHFQSCSLPCHALSLFLPLLSVFFHPILSHALLSHTSSSMLRWESHNASEERGAVECHFFKVFTLLLVRIWESTVMIGGRK